MGWLVPINNLTRDQKAAVRADDRRHQVIVGGPGSGKTQVLVHRADYLRHKRSVHADKYHIFAYTNMLTDYIGSDLDLLNIPEDNVSTYDSWCYKIASKYIGKPAGSWDVYAIRELVSDWARTTGTKLPLYDFVLVDEGQDLPPETFDTLSRVARHVTVCADDKQRIYPQGSTLKQILESLNIRRSGRNLLETYRCTEYIVSLSAQFIADEDERQRYKNQRRAMLKERQTPTLYRAETPEDEITRLADALRDRMGIDQQIAILLPTNQQIREVGQHLRGMGIETEAQTDRNVDFETRFPKVMTFHSAKGLTFDSVMMPALGYVPRQRDHRRYKPSVRRYEPRSEVGLSQLRDGHSANCRSAPHPTGRQRFRV